MQQQTTDQVVNVDEPHPGDAAAVQEDCIPKRLGSTGAAPETAATGHYCTTEALEEMIHTADSTEYANKWTTAGAPLVMLGTPTVSPTQQVAHRVIAQFSLDQALLDERDRY